MSKPERRHHSNLRAGATEASGGQSNDRTHEVDGTEPTGTPSTDAQSTPTPSPAELHGYGQWHTKGLNGDGIKVMVIDPGWEGLESEIIERDGMADRSVGAYCFKTPPLGGTRRPSSVATECEANNTSDLPRHGTEVALALLEVAPDIDLYISNAKDRSEVARLIRWMTTNAPTPGIRAVVHSIDQGWEGPGDGSATDGHPFTDPFLISMQVANEAGILWVAPTGNYATKTWFSNAPTFINGKLDLRLPEDPSAITCLPLQYSRDLEDMDFVLRWGDNWPTNDTEEDRLTNLSLSITADSAETVGNGEQVHDGETQYPLEEFEFSGLGVTDET